MNVLLDPTPIFHLSQTHCVAICAALVPLNVLATLQTLILAGLDRSIPMIRRSTFLAIVLALLMVMHVFTWLLSGVVMAATYILFSLASVCFLCNLWAIVNARQLGQFLRNVLRLGNGLVGRSSTVPSQKLSCIKSST